MPTPSPDPTLPYEAALQAGAASLGIALPPGALAQFARYCALLQAWNRRVNLTAITETQAVYTRHFLDSLTVAPCFPENTATLLDIGSGGGFPGAPLAIALPQLRVTLLEAHARKTAFLTALKEALGLANLDVVTGRAETEAHQPGRREAFDATVTRAVDALAVLAEYQLPFCRVGGVAVAMKQGDIGAELAAAERAIALLGGRLREVRPVRLPGLEGGRCLVVVEKVAPTPPAYPRRPGMPAKRPL